MISLISSERAQAIGIARLFLSLVVGAFVIWIIDMLASPLFDRAEASTQTGSTAATGTRYLQEGVDFLPIAFLGIAFFGLIAYSVYTRAVMR